MSDFSYEFALPYLTGLSVDELRMPEPKEIIIVHGVEERDFRSERLGPIALDGFITHFTEAYTNWHCDQTYVQANLTVEGQSLWRLAALVSRDVPTQGTIKRLIPDLNKNALELNSGPGDLVLFEGFFKRTPVFHEVTSFSSPRKSLLRVAHSLQ